MSTITPSSTDQGSSTYIPTAQLSRHPPTRSSDKLERHKPPAPTCLQTLPTELQVKIFKSLERVPSTCLGLTCKAFYAIHWEVNGKVVLNATYNYFIPTLLNPSPNSDSDSQASENVTEMKMTSVKLHTLLKSWMPPSLTFFGRDTNKFVTRYTLFNLSSPNRKVIAAQAKAKAELLYRKAMEKEAREVEHEHFMLKMRYMGWDVDRERKAEVEYYAELILMEEDLEGMRKRIMGWEREVFLRALGA